EWAENEMTVVQQLQQLKFDYLRQERTRELLNSGPLAYGSGPGGSPRYNPGGESMLKQALSGQMAGEATPEAAVRAIQMLERAEVEAAEELKNLAPEDRKALEARTDELRGLAAALAPKAAAAPTTNSRTTQPGAPRVASSSNTSRSRPPDNRPLSEIILASE